jgi:hypothetical protein
MVHAAWSHNTMAELVLIGSGAGSAQIVNVHCFEASAVEEALFLNDGLANTSAIALRDDWIANLKTLWLACHAGGTGGYVLGTVGVQIVERPALVSHRLGRQDSILTTANIGTDTAAAPAAAENAGVIRWKSLVATRHARGRTYVAPIVSTAGGFPVGLLNATQVAALDAYAAALRVRYKPTGAHDSWNLTVYSRPYDSPHGDYVKRVGGVLQVVPKPDYAGNSNFVINHAIDNIIRSQRRRQVGVGA